LRYGVTRELSTRRAIWVILRLSRESLSNWILVDVFQVPVKVGGIAYSMIGKASLPNLQVRPECHLCAACETAFNERHGPFQAGPRSQESMKVIRHDHELVKQVSRPAVVVESFEK